jgi:phosphocarrier protein
MTEPGPFLSETAVSDPVRVSVEICNLKGLHARASAKFVKLAATFEDTQITVCKDDHRVDGQSILGLMMLAASIGSTIEIEADGPQAQEAVTALAELVANRFDEEA